MALLLLKPCNKPGCPALTRARFCERHAGERMLPMRKSSAKKGYGRRWERARAQYLRENPLCVRHLERNERVRATDVDHRVAVTGPHDPNFWRRSNWQSLCHSCHSRKTMTEDRPRRAVR